MDSFLVEQARRALEAFAASVFAVDPPRGSVPVGDIPDGVTGDSYAVARSHGWSMKGLLELSNKLGEEIGREGNRMPTATVPADDVAVHIWDTQEEAWTTVKNPKPGFYPLMLLGAQEPGDG